MKSFEKCFEVFIIFKVLFNTLMRDPADCLLIAWPYALKIRSVAVPTAYGTMTLILRHFLAAFASSSVRQITNNNAKIKELIFMDAKCILSSAVVQVNHSSSNLYFYI